MKNRILLSLLYSLTVIAATGCATVFKGYMSEVEIKNVPENLQVFTSEGVEVQTETGIKKLIMSGRSVLFPDSSKRIIRLRSDRDHQLVLRDGETTIQHSLYRKLNIWWAVADFIGGGIPSLVDALTGSRSSDARWIPLDVAAAAFPFVVDMTTGNWYYFDKIVYTVQQPNVQRDDKEN